MLNKIAGSIVFALGLLIALTPRYILPVCEWAGKKPMICGHTGRAEIFIGVIIVSIGLGALLSKSAEAIKWLMLVALVSGVAVILVPQVIGYCPSAQMPCHYGAVPLLRLLGGSLAVSSVVIMVLSRRKRYAGG
jgi:hypothetical protein